MYWAADNLLDWEANGVNLDAAHVYFQSEEHRVCNLAYLLARGLSIDLPIDIYGFDKMIKDFPFMFAGITQVGDIVLPQHEEFGNYHSFMVSGQDQDGHMKMTIELVKRAFDQGIELPGIKTIPSGFYIPHIRSLTGGKASSSRKVGTLYLGSGPDKLDLEKRIKVINQIIDDALVNKELEDSANKCALDMVKYIDYFNNFSKVNFKESLDDMPLTLKKKLKDKIDDRVRANLIDEYLIDECKKVKQDNLALIRDTIKDAIVDHYKKRQEVLEYAIERRDTPSRSLWDLDSDQLEPLKSWKIPKKAFVNPLKRNKTQWFDIIYQAKDKLIP